LQWLAIELPKRLERLEKDVGARSSMLERASLLAQAPRT